MKAALPAPLFELAACGYNVPEYLHLRGAVAEFRPDVVYARHARYGVGAALAARHAHVPLALEVNCLFADDLYHQFEPLHFRRMATALERRALDAATVVFPVSSPLVGRVRALTGSTVVLLPNGADPLHFDPSACDGAAVRRRHGLGDGCVLGWVGIMRRWHGLSVLLDAMTHIDGASLLLVGDGPARAAAEERARELGIADRLIVTGRVPHEQVRDYIAAMDVCIVPDEQTGVASPMKLVEYMSMGRAVVAPDLPNIRDLISPGSDGALFVPGDPDSLSAQLHSLTTNAARRQSLGRQARTTVLGRLNWQANAQVVLSSLASVGSGPQ